MGFSNDIRGCKCYSCGKGVAKVVHFVKDSGEHRFFFGCSASTKEEPCKGPKPWMKVQVPENVRLEYAALNNVPYTGSASQKGREKKEKKARRRDDSVVIGPLSITDSVVNITMHKGSALGFGPKKKKKQKRSSDADLWAGADDDDFVLEHD